MTTAPDTLRRLVDVLDDFSRALETGDADVVLAAEEQVADTVSALRGVNLAHLAQQPSVRTSVRDVRLAIERCRRLGRAASDLTALLTPTSYGPRGLRLPAATHGSTVASRT